MKKTQVILEEIKRARLLFGYDTSKTLNEQSSQPGDADGDGDVDQDDLDLVTNNWLQQGENIPGDINNDGIVNLEDLNAVINNFGQSTTDKPDEGPSEIDYTPSYTTEGPYSGNFDPNSWWSTFIQNAESRPNYRKNKCNFFNSRIRTWQGKMPDQSAIQGGAPQLGDSNSDGTVNQTDLDYVNNNWLQDGDVYDSDDGIVNLEDMTLVINNWLQGTETDTTALLHSNMLNVKIEMTTDYKNNVGC